MPDHGSAPVEPTQERRTVSILFADLAGFTQRSDQADPEDVGRILVPFHALAKEEIERFGGSLDKFIGDAAMGVFGAPVAHEDDPERAVRAALSIRQRVNELAMPVRVAVNTGEALVTFATGPQVGENIAGDVVNTASRLQSVAPVGGVVVGADTHRATHAVVEYRSLDPVSVKGKARALEIWEAVSVGSSGPARDEDHPPPFVGREPERARLAEALDRVLRTRRLQMITIVGDPGIGKTRLVSDLVEHVKSDGPSVSRLRGRCLPYGESITFAPLEEIVRDALDVRAGDDTETVEAKLDAGIDAVDRSWVASRLRPLVGMTGDTAPVDRMELFSAWARFLEDRARRRPMLLVVEDLHWADGPLLDFLTHLTDSAAEAPILLVCTARPELLADHPTWGRGTTNSTTLSLSPLGEREMSDLVDELLGATPLGLEHRSSLMSRADGNPLYAREFVHMLEDRSERPESPDMPGAFDVPGSVQGLIAARMDALSSATRALLHDASVIGDRFWPGALDAINPATAGAEGSLNELERRRLIERSPASALAGEPEFAFAHTLIREVAYGQLPRTIRAERHVALTDWLERGGGRRLPDLPDLLAFHAGRALELAEAAGMDDGLASLRLRTRGFLMLAGERQTPLDQVRAARLYARALELTEASDPLRAELIRLATRLGWRAGTMSSEEAVAAYHEALALATAADDRRTAAQLMRRLYAQLGAQGNTVEARAFLDRAIEMLEDDAATDDETQPVLANLYACRSEVEMFAGRSGESLRWAERALAMPTGEDTRLMALHLRGNAWCEMGDTRGINDLREALDLAREGGEALEIAQSLSYLAEWTGLQEGPAAALTMNDESVRLCASRGIKPQEMWSRAERLWPLFDAGRWDEIMDETDRLLGWAEEYGDSQVASVALTYRARVLAHRRRSADARDLTERFLPIARIIEDLQVLAHAVSVAAFIEARDGRREAAADLLREFDRVTREAPSEYREILLPETIEAALIMDEVLMAEALFRDRSLPTERTRLAVAMSRARVAEAKGQDEVAATAYLELADVWGRWSDGPEAAYASAGAARTLGRLGRADEAERADAAAARRCSALGIEA